VSESLSSASCDFQPGEQQPVVTWRVATPGDRAALSLLHFDTEVASGLSVYFSDQLFESGDVLIAEVDGKVIGGLLLEDALIATLVGLDKRVGESAKPILVERALSLAREDGKQLVQVRFPRNVTLDLHTDEKFRTGRNTQ
jgi:hypothetical protein